MRADSVLFLTLMVVVVDFCIISEEIYTVGDRR
jgi:hypothetical protein